MVKDIIRNADSGEEQAVPLVLEIEAESLRLLEASRRNKQEMSACYLEMLEALDDTDQTQEKVQSLKRATTNITKALAQTATVSDELTARWNAVKKQKRKRKFLTAAPANAAIDLSESQS